MMVNGMNLSVIEVKNITTGVVLSSNNDNMAAYVDSIGNDNGVGGAIQGPTRKDSKVVSKVGTDWSNDTMRKQRSTEMRDNCKAPTPKENVADGRAGAGGGIATAAMEYQEVKNSFQPHTEVISGKDYLKQQAQSAKIAQKTQKTAKAAQKINEQQNINPDRNGTSSEDFGGN